MSIIEENHQDPIPRLSSLTRDLAHLHYERSQAEQEGAADEARSITDAIAHTKREIATLTSNPQVEQQFESYRQEQFSLVSHVHDLQRMQDHIHDLKEQEHSLARKHAVRTPSSHTKNRLQHLRDEKQTLQQQLIDILSRDPTLALAWRSWELREYRRQFVKDRFVETPSRTVLLD